MKCSVCKIDYPDELVDELTSLLDAPFMACGICALEYMNSIDGMNRTRFDGGQAEQMRLAAIKWRKDNPDGQTIH